MASFPTERFEAEAERFLRARQGREWQFRTGAAPGRSLKSLYRTEFPSLCSFDAYDELAGSPIEPPRRRAGLQSVLASAILECEALDQGAQVARLESQSTSLLADLQEPVAWRSAPRRWLATPDVGPRHQLHEAWREFLRGELTPSLQRWLEVLGNSLERLAPGTSWTSYWMALRGYEPKAAAELASGFLELGEELYVSTLGVYLSQRGLPAGDAWDADADWAFREPRFDAAFPPRGVMPTVNRVHRDLGIELAGQAGLTLKLAELSSGLVGSRVLPAEVPHDVRAAVGLVGGYADLQSTLRALGEAQHALRTDSSLPLHERRLGDPTTTRAYGLLLEGLTRDRSWLLERATLGEGLADFLVIVTLAWARRARTTAALVCHHAAAWEDPFAGGLAADYAQRLSEATGLRHFPEPYLLELRGETFEPLGALVDLRAEVLAAHLRLFLRAEYDEHWWRNPRAGRFLVEELWRPGRRYSAEQVIEHMGHTGFDVRLLSEEMRSILASV